MEFQVKSLIWKGKNMTMAEANVNTSCWGEKSDLLKGRNECERLCVRTHALCNNWRELGVVFPASFAGVSLSLSLSVFACPHSGSCGFWLWRMGTRQKSWSSSAAVENLIHLVSDITVSLTAFHSWKSGIYLRQPHRGLTCTLAHNAWVRCSMGCCGTVVLHLVSIDRESFHV